MFKNSRSNGSGRKNSTPSESRSKFHYIGSPLSARMIFIFLHYLLSFVTVTSSAHQRCLCSVISSSAAISVPHRVRVWRYYGPLGDGGGPSLGDRPPGGGGGPSSLGWGRTRRGGYYTRCVYWGEFVDLPTYSTVKCMCFQAVKGITSLQFHPCLFHGFLQASLSPTSGQMVIKWC